MTQHSKHILQSSSEENGTTPQLVVQSSSDSQRPSKELNRNNDKNMMKQLKLLRDRIAHFQQGFIQEVPDTTQTIKRQLVSQSNQKEQPYAQQLSQLTKVTKHLSQLASLYLKDDSTAELVNQLTQIQSHIEFLNININERSSSAALKSNPIGHRRRAAPHSRFVKPTMLLDEPTKPKLTLGFTDDDIDDSSFCATKRRRLSGSQEQLSIVDNHDQQESTLAMRRPKRDIKKTKMSTLFCYENAGTAEDVSPYSSNTQQEEDSDNSKHQKTGHKKKQSQAGAATQNSGAAAVPGQLQQSKQARKIQVPDTQDPFSGNMERQLLEPIVAYDRLNVLSAANCSYDVLLRAKDLKQLSKERREELLTQRVWFDNPSESIDQLRQLQHEIPSLTLILEMRDDFVRHNGVHVDSEQYDERITSKITSQNEDIAQTGDDDMQDSDSEGEEVDRENDQADKSAMNSSGANSATFKKPKRRKRRQRLCFSSSRQTKAVQQKQAGYSCLPVQTRACTWIENIESNKLLLREHSQQFQKERQRRNLEKQALNDELYGDSETQDRDENQDKLNDEREVESVSKLNQKQDRGDCLEDKKSSGDEINQLVGDKVIDEDQPMSYVESADLKSIDQICTKFHNGYYHNLNFLLEDLQVLITNSMMRCKSNLSRVYLTNFLLHASRHITSKRKDFEDRWLVFYQAKLTQNEERNCMISQNKWYNKFDETTKRQYFELQDYKVKIPGEKEPVKSSVEATSEQPSLEKQKEKQQIREIMRTDKKTKCSGECCKKSEPLKKEDITVFGQLQPSLMKCSCAKQKSECSAGCGCDPNQCNNRQMALKQSLRFGIDIVERVTWGMDTCTAVNFITICPRDLNAQQKSNFVAKKLAYAIQQQGEQGYDVKLALEFIINVDLMDSVLASKYDQQDKQIARILLDAIKNFPEENGIHFKVHTKGVGIFCNRKEGIDCNTLVIEYFGEIYRPWHWYEKQDVIKQGQNCKKLPKDLPDFYNITFERHMDDPDGYNILTIDPILHGNFSSRLSHSCSPNCQTINKVRGDGTYSIGMFCNQEISFGEELCFDYCSFTESEKEYEEAICLCATALCKGRYLNLANDKKNLGIMKTYHNFVDRNFIIFKSILDPELSHDDNLRLDRNGLKDSCLSPAPVWLRKWASLICEYLEFEERLFPYFFKGAYAKHLRVEDIKIDAKLQKETQIQNIAITIDKIVHVLSTMKTKEAPIRTMTYQEMFRKFWEDSNSLRFSTVAVLEAMEPCAQVTAAKQCFNVHDAEMKETEERNQLNLNENVYRQQYDQARKALSDVSAILRSVNSQKVQVPAMCDILMMYANTEHFFTQTEAYKKCKSNEVNIRNCDVRHPEGACMDKFSQGKSTYNGSKEYDCQYIWGQLVGWFKQTVDKPNASLSADRRGTLSIPDIHSFILLNCRPQASHSKKSKDSSTDQFEEEIPVASHGTRSRPRKESTAQLKKGEKNVESPALTKKIELAKTMTGEKLKIIYPSKRNSTRKDFLRHWPDTFAKQWDVCCQWHFQNKLKIYGSIQLESIVRADKQLQLEKQRLYKTCEEPEELNQKLFEAYRHMLDNRMAFMKEFVDELLRID